MAEKFILFDDAVRELGMSADELKGLMDEGKIRHFMDSGKIKFRQKDIDDLKASLGVTAPEEPELSLAPPEDAARAPQAEGVEDVPPPPPAYKEEEFSIEPLDAGPTPATIGTAPPAGKKRAAPEPAAEEMEPEKPKEEEVASLEDFAVSADEQGAELSGDEAEMLAMQGSLRGYEEAGEGSVGMTVMLVVAVIVVALGFAMLLSFPLGINPFESLTSLFASQ